MDHTRSTARAIASLLLTFLMFTAAKVDRTYAQQAKYLFLRHHLICLQSNSEKYLALQGKKIIIYTPECPHISSSALASLLTSIGPTRAVKEERQYDELIVLDADELRCLLAAPLPEVGDLIEFDRSDCTLKSYNG